MKKKDKRPEKAVWLAFEDGFIAQSANTEKFADGSNVFPEGDQPRKFINSDVIEKWAEEHKAGNENLIQDLLDLIHVL